MNQNKRNKEKTRKKMGGGAYCARQPLTIPVRMEMSKLLIGCFISFELHARHGSNYPRRKGTSINTNCFFSADA